MIIAASPTPTIADPITFTIPIVLLSSGRDFCEFRIAYKRHRSIGKRAAGDHRKRFGTGICKQFFNLFVR